MTGHVGPSPGGSAACPQARRPKVYFARAMDGLDTSELAKRGEQVSALLAQTGFDVIDTLLVTPQAAIADPISISRMIDIDLGLLKQADVVLMDMSIPDRNYVGCVCELTYAYLWGIPIVVYVGRTSNGVRPWLIHHATEIYENWMDAVRAAIKAGGARKSSDKPSPIPPQRDIWNAWHVRPNHSSVPSAHLMDRLLKHLPPSPARILEIGCSTGRDARRLATMGHVVTALDVSNVAIAQAIYATPQSLKRSLEYQCLDVASTTLLPITLFDVIYSHLALHYFTQRDTRRIFAYFGDVTTCRGVLAIAVKSTADPLFGVGEEVERNVFVRKGHIRRFFTEEDLLALLPHWDVLELTPYEAWEEKRVGRLLRVMAKKL